MNRGMQEVSVYTHGNEIMLAQQDGMEYGIPAVINLDIDQIDIICQWLQEAKEELLGELKQTQQVNQQFDGHAPK